MLIFNLSVHQCQWIFSCFNVKISTGPNLTNVMITGGWLEYARIWDLKRLNLFPIEIIQYLDNGFFASTEQFEERMLHYWARKSVVLQRQKYQWNGLVVEAHYCYRSIHPQHFKFRLGVRNSVGSYNMDSDKKLKFGAECIL